MLDLNKMLDTAQETCSPANGNGLAAALGVKPSAVSNWKHGRAYPDPVSCERIARMIGEPPVKVIAQVNELRAVSKAEKAVWHRIAIAAVLAIVASPAMAGNFVYSGLAMPIMSGLNAVQRRIQRLGTLFAGAWRDAYLSPLPA